MYCKYCGRKINDKAIFCAECGKKVKKKSTINQDIISKSNLLNNSNNNRKKKKIIGLAVLCITIIGIGMLVFGGRSYKKVIDVCVKSSMSGKAKGVEKMYKLLPEEVQDATLQYYMENYSGGKEEMMKELQEQYKEEYDKIEDTYGEGWRYSYKIAREEDATRKQIREWKEDIIDSDEVDVDFNREIKEMKYITVEITTQSKDKKTEKTDSMTVTVLKIGRTWYLADAI